MNQSRPVPTLSADDIERFSQFFRAGSGCWVWEGARDAKGYGQFKVNGQAWWAHRVAYTLAHGPIRAGMWVHHVCNNPRCVNPDHLVEVTPRENSEEAAIDSGAEVPF